MNIDPSELGPWLRATKEALSLLKAGIDLLPKSDKKQKAEQLFLKAEEAQRQAEAAMARDLGYDLCRKHWPPGIQFTDDKGIHCTICGNDEDSSKLSDVEERILVFMAARENGASAKIVSEQVSISVQRARHYLDQLTHGQYIDLARGITVAIAGMGRSEEDKRGPYWLSKKGRAYLIGLNLID